MSLTATVHDSKRINPETVNARHKHSSKKCIKPHHHQSHMTSFTRPSLGSLPLQPVDPHCCLLCPFSNLNSALPCLASSRSSRAVLCISPLSLRLDMCRCAKAASGAAGSRDSRSPSRPFTCT
ncbi:hypothetical protein V8C34DRAFT_287400 [Trichoderma compactum]